MREDVINREVALLLCEKGFSLDFEYRWGYYGYHCEYNDINPYNKLTNYNIPAPTFSEVVRWIKDQYGLEVFANPVGSIYYGYVIDYANKPLINAPYIRKKTYNEALTACIIQTLENV